MPPGFALAYVRVIDTDSDLVVKALETRLRSRMRSR
jgi:hypothetical protein